MESSHFHVPWYSMEEWNLVYSQIYSPNIEDMTRAYRRILVWKTRIENLPAGVECTLGILQVRLRELNVSSHLSQEDLQLMYSTAIIRFLNMMAELEQGNTRGEFSTLYYKARAMHIPHWIVKLRHDAAHSSSLPPLHTLKSAADFIFNWLHDYYWKNEVEHTQDYFIDVPDNTKLYSRRTRHIFSLIEIYLSLASSKSKRVDADTLAQLISLNPQFKARDRTPCMRNIVHDVSQLLMKETKKPDLLEMIVNQTDLLNFDTEDPKSRSERHKVWTSVLNILNKHGLLVYLLRSLVETLAGTHDEIRCKQLATWINDICKGFLKLERCLHIQLDLEKRDIGTPLTPKLKFLLVVQVADRTYTNLKTALLIKGKLPAAVEFKAILEEALRAPSQHTMAFLENLCLVSRVPKSPLAQLINLYLNNRTAPSHCSQMSQVFTVESLTRLCGGPHEATSASHENTDVDMTNVWRRADDLDWVHCPLGCAPSDTQDMYLDIELLNSTQL